MTRIFNRRLKRFKLKLKLEDKTISEYFNLDPNIIIDIHPNISQNLYLLNIKYNNFGDIFLFPNLPYELNNSIAKFNDVHIHLKIQVRVAESYPFTEPIWSLLNVKSNIYNIEKYYQFMIDEFNNLLKESWAPYICCEKEILLFLTRINNFDYFSIY